VRDAPPVLATKPSLLSLGLFALGWVLGWLLLWRLRPLPPVSASTPRPPIAVVVPARDEGAFIGAVVGALRAQQRAGDELVVVDDGSRDGTSELAARSGATVVAAGELPPGWLGKPYACAAGVAATRAPIVVLIDADVRPATDLLDRLAVRVATAPDALTSVQPWHVVRRPSEQLNLLFNVAALMGSGGFTALGERLERGPARHHMAFGPVLACTRAAYEVSGGHGAPGVRDSVAEDLALAARFPSVRLYTGGPGTTFRMYPGGVVALFRGWSKNLATGAAHTRWWIALAAAGWIASLAGGWLVSPWFSFASALQVYVLGRRSGRFSPIAALVYPVLVAVFVVVFAWSAVVTIARRPVSWKGRRVRARSTRRPSG
jgi:4,4'-diaponeurosporenoate glycosyltransferase